MTTFVIDSSILVKWLNQENEEDITQADRLLEDTKNGLINLIAPEIAKYEAGNVLLKGKQLNPTQAADSLQSLYSLPIEWMSQSEHVAEETFHLAYDLGITYYDASFLSLAKQYDAILITQNMKHQGKAKDIVVKSLQDY